MTRVIADVSFGLFMLAVLVLARLVSERTKVPYAVLLTVLALVYAVLPGRNLHLEPELVLYLVLPPLLYSAALDSSLLALRRNLRSVVSLSVVLVLVTAVSVGVVTAAIVPGMSIALGLAFGAAVAPPDPVASLSVGRRAGLPPRLTTLIEGEGLFNDATALTLYQVAVTAAVAGTGFSVGVATGKFALAALGGLAIGVALAGALRLCRPLMRDPMVANVVSLGTPFAAYTAGESIHVSGVLAVVVTALIVGHTAPRTASGAGRLQTTAVWHLVDFLLEGFVFLLIGQQLPEVVRGLDEYSTGTLAGAAGASVGLVLVVRPLFLVLSNIAPRFLHARLGGRYQSALTGREIVAMSWAGTRGVISLAIAFALPLTTKGGDALPGRDLVVFCAYLVVLVTLVGQGVTFAPLLRRLGVGADPADSARRRNEARVAAVEAALKALEDVADDEDVPSQVLADLRRQLQSQERRYRLRLDAIAAIDDDGVASASPSYEAALRARRAVIDVQREELLRWRDSGRLSDKELRTLQTELDLEERILPDSR
jgi:monovalent cation/hydrogen antiporter